MPRQIDSLGPIYNLDAAPDSVSETGDSTCGRSLAAGTLNRQPDRHASPCRRPPDCYLTLTMTDPAPHPSERIEAALARIEAAARKRSEERRDLARRHAQLRERVAEAVAAIDDLSSRVERV